MRGQQERSGTLFSDVSIEDRFPASQAVFPQTHKQRKMLFWGAGVG